MHAATRAVAVRVIGSSNGGVLDTERTGTREVTRTGTKSEGPSTLSLGFGAAGVYLSRGLDTAPSPRRLSIVRRVRARWMRRSVLVLLVAVALPGAAAAKPHKSTHK